jgi:hypothetical protein
MEFCAQEIRLQYTLPCCNHHFQGQNIVNSSWANANHLASKAMKLSGAMNIHKSQLVAALSSADGLFGNSLASNEGFATNQLGGWLQNHPFMEMMEFMAILGMVDN